MLKRINEIHIMLDDDEYATFLNLQAKTGLNKRQFIMNAISDKPFVTAEYIEELKKLNTLIDRFNELIKKDGVNINQLARIGNTNGELPTVEELEKISGEISKIRKGAERIWQYTRSCLQQEREQKAP
jgi:hypothetical protein